MVYTASSKNQYQEYNQEVQGETTSGENKTVAYKRTGRDVIKYTYKRTSFSNSSM
jgi:hypothetical protein